MPILLLFAFAALFAISFNYAQPKALGYFPNFAGSYWGITLVTTFAVMALLVVVSWVFATLGQESKGV